MADDRGQARQRGYAIAPVADGYSVNEAASVLGIPEARVWELLARGVLAGVPEASGGMRVVFADREAVQPAAAAPPPINGGSHAELSPFRELLTEFRNLTERYGQALLALGEARGEVASLRSRVEVLEARMDLRLTGPAPEPGPISWRATPGPMAEPPPAPAAPAVQPAPPRPRARPRKSRAGGTREAVAGFAEAMARAEDPGTPVLPGAREAAEALAVLRREQAAAAAAAAAAVPSPPIAAVPAPVPPVAAAKPPEPAVSVQVSEPPGPAAAPTPPPEPAAATLPGYSTDVVEPDWFADGDFTWLEAADAVPAPAAEPEPEAAVAPEPEPMPEPEAAAPRAPAAEPEPVVAAPPAPAPPVAEGSPVVAEEVAAALAPDREPPAARTAAPTPVPPRAPLVAPIAEPFGEELIGEVLPAQREVSQPAAPFVRAGIRPVAPTDAAADVERVRLSNDEFEQLAHDEGWDEAEIRAIRAFLGRPGEVSPRAPLARTAPRPAVEPISEAPPASRQAPAVAQRRSPVGGAFRRLRRLLLG